MARGANKQSAKDAGTGAARRRPRRIGIPAPSGTAASPVEPLPVDTGWPTGGLEESGDRPEAGADAGQEPAKQAGAEDPELAGNNERAHAQESVFDDLMPENVFDEAGYLRLNADVRHAVAAGSFDSGYTHYRLHGRTERRPLPDTPREQRNVMLASPADAARAEALPSEQEARCSIDALILAPRAGLMIVAWLDDAAQPLTCIRIVAADWRLVLDDSRIVRVRRTDVEKAIGGRAGYAFGIFGFVQFAESGDTTRPVTVELWQNGGRSTTLHCSPVVVEDIDLRNTALGYLASATFFGNPIIESMRQLRKGSGAELVRLNTAITRRLTAAPYIERFGPRRASPRGSIIVCLYGKLEYFFLQNCLYSGLPGIDEYEFIYVSNSPELAETLLREAYSAQLVYGLTTSVVILPGNAGFAGANNVGSRVAHSGRLLAVNPDVFPRDREWARKHLDLLGSAPEEQTRLFGVPLFYDDGSLMHGGMYFETDTGLSMASGQPVVQRLCRVEHYGKGAAAESAQLTRARPVPAITGAFISIDRTWFENLGGFSEDFIFGHYEDADLCLKSIERGAVPWLHDIRMWHLEGKGSTRQPAHDGGLTVNRWLFTERWLQIIEDHLQGPTPSHPALQPHAAVTPAATPSRTPPGRMRRKGWLAT